MKNIPKFLITWGRSWQYTEVWPELSYSKGLWHAGKKKQGIHMAPIITLDLVRIVLCCQNPRKGPVTRLTDDWVKCTV